METDKSLVKSMLAIIPMLNFGVGKTALATEIWFSDTNPVFPRVWGALESPGDL